MSVTRIFVEKKPGFDVEAKHIQTDLTENLGIRGIEELRLLHRYDVEGLSQKEQEDANRMIFSEPNVDHLYGEDFLMTTMCLQWNICPVSMTSVQIPQRNAYNY